MNEQSARELLMDYLYSEISETDRKKLEKYLQTHPGMQQELDELRAVRGLLQEAPEFEADEKLLPIESHSRSFSEWRSQAADLLPRSGWGKTLVAAAACLLLFFMGSAAANLNIHSTESGFSIRLGYGQKPMKNQPDIAQVRPKAKKSEPQQIGLTKKQMEAIVQQMRKQNAKILEKYAKNLTENNRQQLQQVVNYFKQKRQNNLQLFQIMLDDYQTQLNQYQQKTNYKLLRTHQVMGKMAQAIEVSSQQ